MDYYYGGYGYGSSSKWAGLSSRRRGLNHAPLWKSTAYSNGNYVESSGSSSEAEAKRKKRVAKYKSYEREKKVKTAIKRGFKWLKNKFERLVNGF